MAERKVLPIRLDDSLLAALDEVLTAEGMSNRSDTARALLTWAVLTMKPGWRPGQTLPAYLDKLSRADLLARSRTRKG